MDTACRTVIVRTSKKLTRKQLNLLDAIERRRRHGLPTVQRDLAEALGIRRESLNKLLRRTRERLAARGDQVHLPGRLGGVQAAVVCLADGVVI